MNTAENREKLAREVAEGMDIKDLICFAAEGIEANYENDPTLFEEDWENYFPDEN